MHLYIFVWKHFWPQTLTAYSHCTVCRELTASPPVVLVDWERGNSLKICHRLMKSKPFLTVNDDRPFVHTSIHVEDSAWLRNVPLHYYNAPFQVGDMFQLGSPKGFKWKSLKPRLPLQRWVPISKKSLVPVSEKNRCLLGSLKIIY